MPYFILELTYSDGCTYSCTNQQPIEYESGEALICDLMDAALTAAKNNEWEFKFLGREFNPGDFVKVREITQGKNKGKQKFTLYNPDITSLEDWLNQNALRQNPEKKQQVKPKHKLVELIFALEEGFSIEHEVEDVFVPLAENPDQTIRRGRFTQGLQLEIVEKMRRLRLTGYRSAIDSPITAIFQLFSDPDRWKIGEKVVRA